MQAFIEDEGLEIDQPARLGLEEVSPLGEEGN